MIWKPPQTCFWDTVNNWNMCEINVSRAFLIQITTVTLKPWTVRCVTISPHLSHFQTIKCCFAIDPYHRWSPPVETGLPRSAWWCTYYGYNIRNSQKTLKNHAFERFWDKKRSLSRLKFSQKSEIQRTILILTDIVHRLFIQIVECQPQTNHLRSVCQWHSSRKPWFCCPQVICRRCRTVTFSPFSKCCRSCGLMAQQGIRGVAAAEWGGFSLVLHTVLCVTFLILRASVLTHCIFIFIKK